MGATTAVVSTFSWKQLAVRSLLGGAACGVVVALALISFFLYQERPKAWDARALRAVHVKALPIDQLDEKFNVVGSGIFFEVDVENTTATDVSLPQTLTVMGKAKDSHALHGSFLKLNGDYFIPAKQVVTVTLDADQICAAHYDPQKCFDDTFKNDEGIVVFDTQDRDELQIPMPSLTVMPGPPHTLALPQK